MDAIGGRDSGSSASGDPQEVLEGSSSLLLIDHRSLTRDCLEAALRGAGIKRIISAANIHEAIGNLTCGLKIDAILINLAGEGFSEEGLRAITGPLRTMLPDSPLLLLAERVDSQQAAIAMRNGVRGLLSRDLALGLTIAALHFVELGWMLFPSEFLPAIMEADSVGCAEEPGATPQLTRRQRQVLHHLRTGMSNKNIGLRLNITERTVKAHVKELMRRLGVSNRTQVVARLAKGSTSLG